MRFRSKKVSFGRRGLSVADTVVGLTRRKTQLVCGRILLNKRKAARCDNFFDRVLPWPFGLQGTSQQVSSPGVICTKELV